MSTLWKYFRPLWFLRAQSIPAWVMIVGALMMASPRGWAASSRMIVPFQGAVAVKPGQAPLDANPYGAKFEIFTAVTEGASIFEDIQQIAIRNGAFSVELGGGVTPLTAELIRDNEDLWLEVTIDLNRNGTYDEDERIAPRIHLGAAPLALYSVLAAQSATVGLPTMLRNGDGETVAEINDKGAYIPKVDLGSNDDPEPGSLYRDNVCIAWGLVKSNGDLLAGFGIDEVDWDQDDLSYVIKLTNRVEELQDDNDAPAYSIVVTSHDGQIRPELAIAEPIDDNDFRVHIFALDLMEVLSGGDVLIPRVQSLFSVQVFGRLVE